MVRVAVIGAGVSGLTSIKCCLDEGLDVTCFEASDHIGGLWYFTEKEDQGSVCRSTVMNTSKEMTSCSDFPPPKDFPVYMHNTKVLEYLTMYGEHFNAKKYIKFNTKVVNVYRTSDDPDTKYKVTYANFDKEITGQTTEEFDAVMVCIGHHWKPSWPTFDGMDKFKGIQMHSKNYKDFWRFKDKVVVIVGIGNSGGDITVELSRHCKQVYLSTRKGAWIVPRAVNGKPGDQLINSRVMGYVPRKVSRSVVAQLIKSLYNYEKLGLQPSTPYLSHHPTANDDLPCKILHCMVKVKPNIMKLAETGVVFEDGTIVDNVDAIIYATGYEIGFPCLSSDLVQCENNQVTLYKYMFPPDQRNLCIIGCLQPLGAIMPLAELQARWATRVFKGLCQLPSKEKMLEDIDCKRREIEDVYYASKRHTIEVDVVTYADEIATEIGCRPNIWRLLCEDFRLGLYCFFGPTFPYQYRLQGPGKWDGAKKALFSAEENVTAATKTRVVQGTERGILGSLLVPVIVLFICVLLCWTR